MAFFATRAQPIAARNSDGKMDARLPLRSAGESVSEDTKRLALLGYTQEVKRIFNGFTNFGLTSSMISILLGIIPLYSFSLDAGGPAVMVYSWIIVGLMTLLLVSSLAEICSAYPTMGALYYWAFRLGGPEWGGFASWMAGWTNLLGQIAGVASGGFAGAQIFAEIIMLTHKTRLDSNAVLGLYVVMLVIAGIVNTFAERLLTAVCYISCVWQTLGTILIVVWMLVASPKLQSASFVFASTNNGTGFSSFPYVALVGTLAAASVFTGYDTAAHVAEETHDSHNSTPRAMLLACVNALVLGVLLIVGMNYSIQGSIESLLPSDDDGSQIHQAYTIIWERAVGPDATILFLVITLVAIECSNCANLTSAARMIFSFSRDRALPGSKFWYKVDEVNGGPTRAIWLSLLIAFLLGVPSVGNSAVLNALFSLTATGLYSSYLIPILLRITVARASFQPAEWNLGAYSVPIAVVSVVWGLLMIILLCLPAVYPIKASNLNYSPIVLGIVLLYALAAWHFDAKRWFKGAVLQAAAAEVVRGSEQQAVGPKEGQQQQQQEQQAMLDFIPLAGTVGKSDEGGIEI